MLEISYKSTNTVFEKKNPFLLIHHWKLCTNYDRASIPSKNRYFASSEYFFMPFPLVYHNKWVFVRNSKVGSPTLSLNLSIPVTKRANSLT